jgi:hypothetical protein
MNCSFVCVRRHSVCVELPHRACRVIETGVSVQQNGGVERPGNCRSATKTQRKLAPRRKVGNVGSWLLGCWLGGRLASQRIYTSSDIFLLLDKPFRLLVMVLVPVCLTHAMLVFCCP